MRRRDDDDAEVTEGFSRPGGGSYFP